MPEDPTIDIGTQMPPAAGTTNGSLVAERAALIRQVVLLRARCSNMRHWCWLMLSDPATTGVLVEETAAELGSTSPEVSESEGQTVVALLARGGNVPPNHPLAPPVTDAVSLRADIARLTPEVERLRKAFFGLYDHLHPHDDLTDEYFLELRAQGSSGQSITDLIAEFERESEVNS